MIIKQCFDIILKASETVVHINQVTRLFCITDMTLFHWASVYVYQ